MSFVASRTVNVIGVRLLGALATSFVETFPFILALSLCITFGILERRFVSSCRLSFAFAFAFSIGFWEAAVVPLSESFQISFAIAPKRRPSKGIGKGGTHSSVDSNAPLLGATSSTAARDGPTTRSSPGASATTLGSLVDAN